MSINYPNLRTTRTATALLIAGIYLMILGSKLLIRDNNPKFDVPEAYNQNIWKPHIWKRGQMISLAFLNAVLMVWILQFSMGNLFGMYMYYFMVAYKVLQVIIETILMKIFCSQLLMGPIAVANDLMGNLFTFGAPNFLAFLISIYYDLCITMIDRAYYSYFTNWAQEELVKLLEFLGKFLSTRFFSTSSHPEENAKEGQIGGKDHNKEEHEDSSQSDNDPVFIKQSSIIESDDEQDEEEKKENSPDSSGNSGKKSGEENEVKEENKSEDNDKKSQKENSSMEGQVEVEPLLDIYHAFGRNNLGMFLNVIFFE